MTQKEEPEDAAGRGQERHAGRTAISDECSFQIVLNHNTRCDSISDILNVARKRRKQVSTRGHKFSILENVLSAQSSLLGQALVGAKPLHLLSQTALPLESPTGAFIASQLWPFPKPCSRFAPLVRKCGVSFLHSPFHPG